MFPKRRPSRPSTLLDYAEQVQAEEEAQAHTAADSATADAKPFIERVPAPLPQATHVARVHQRRGVRPSLFDDLPEDVAEAPALPPQSRSDPPRPTQVISASPANPIPISSGPKGKARDILAAIRTLKQVEAEQRLPTADERQTLQRFGGFGAVALSIFPDPQTHRFKDGWQQLGEELQSLLTPEEYASARRTTYTAFYTAPVVMSALHQALTLLSVPDNALILEPGCGSGNFLAHGKPTQRFVGVEQDAISGRIARVLYPQADIRIINFRDTILPKLDAVIGNVPFADTKLEFHGQKLALHDFFLAKSVEALKPGGVLAVVTSRYSLDKQNASARELLASQADFLGAIRLPSDAFQAEGTSVVTDLVFLRKRAVGEPAHHADPDWLSTGELHLDGASFGVNQYFLNHPEMVLGEFSRQDTLYGEGFSIRSRGELAPQLQQAIGQLPRFAPPPSPARQAKPPPQEPASVPLPNRGKLSEGNLFVGDDRIIRQVEHGSAVPVTYGGTLLKSNGTKTGQRLTALIGLRDATRRVLSSQNEGWPEDQRNAARRDLNRLYDRFVSDYGPINTTTQSESKTGTLIRRMPNLVKFRDDPDALLVMSLEEYDEVTGTASKAAILTRDVVGPKPPVTQVTSAEAGLLVSLNQTGSVDLALISRLYGHGESEIINELGDLIYRDPASDVWETADAYLSGNVRAKLVQAEQAGPEFVRNADALRAVQPEDVLPGDIEANLGASWIPASDIQAFACELFGVPPESIRIDHSPREAFWSIEADYRAVQSVAATADFGTGRINGTVLLDQALNLKTPTIYDTVHSGDKEERVLNSVETQAAREKQKHLKEKFRAWVFRDPDRTERLVRAYNDAFNNLRPRLFDGSHLDFPGMSTAITLRPHQVDAVWRCMTAGNTLLAHAVGAGKTNVCIASAMKMKQAGLIHKPMVVCPNHMLEQFSREWLQLYPNAKLLIASQEDFTREKRKLLTAKIATGDWDGIVVTHSSFERIGLSKELQAEFLREQIAEYESLLLDKSPKGRNLLKTLEKQKANREERLRSLLAEDKKDDGLVFDELGIDQLFIDEFQAYKNLETPTKMERVAGIPSGGSERAFDLFLKARYLDRQHPGHGLVGASGTPISNSMVELYTLQRYFDPHGLASRGIDHFDAWAGTFGEVVETMEISPDGSTLKPRSRFAKFVNLPELIQQFRSFADVQTAEQLQLPRPALQGGKPQTVACPMSEEQAVLQARLVERYERIRSQRVDPREDNALAITTDGRKLALDARMLGSAPAHPDCKIQALAKRLKEIWLSTTALSGTQLVFCDLGVNPTPWGFSAYDDLRQELEQDGIPANQIAVMGDADSDAKKQALFERVRQGRVRVLIGSTAKMGTGTNVQKRLVALHHLDAPWKPAEVEQREGRILRQGNQNAEVSIYRYVTEGSFDAYMWQALETKARFIAQVMNGDTALRSAEDIGGQELSYAEVKAIASGNPAVLTLAETEAELQRLAILRKNHADEQYLARRNLKELPERIEQLTKRIAKLSADANTAQKHQNDPVTIGQRAYSRDDALAALGQKLDSILVSLSDSRVVPLGRYRGLGFGIVMHALGRPEAYIEGALQRRTELKENPGPRAVFNALDRLIESCGAEKQRAEQDKAVAEGQLRDYRSRVGVEFAQAEYLRALSELRDRLQQGLAGRSGEGEPSVAEVAEQIQKLRAANQVEGVAKRPTTRAHRHAERPVTARIKQRLAELVPVVESDEGSPPPGGPPQGHFTEQEHSRKQRQTENAYE